MSKIKKSELLDIVREQGSAITNLLQRVAFLENPHLKHLDQNIFEGVFDWVKSAAVNPDGSAYLFSVSKDDFYNISDKYGFQITGRDKCKCIGLGYDTTNWQKSLIERESKPQLKQLDQSVFDGLDEKWRFAAVDSDGSRAVFTSDNITQTYGKHYVNALSGEVKQVLGRVDASNWQNSLIERDTAKKQLDQSIFDELDEKWRWAAFNTPSNSPVLFSVKPYESMRGGWYSVLGRDEYMILGELEGVYEYTDDWQNSLIERDTAELLEVDLSSELTGSDLTKSILSKKFMQACLVSDSSDNDALQGDDLQLIRMYNEENGKFISMRDPWYGCQHKYAVAVDNNRKPLTASEVGL